MIILSLVKLTDCSSCGTATTYLSFMGMGSWQVLPQLSSCFSTVSNWGAGLALGTNEKRYGQRPVATSTDLSYRDSESLLQVLKKNLLTQVLVLSKLDSHYQSTVKWKIKEESRELFWKA